jgi:hypothetical protein
MVFESIALITYIPEFRCFGNEICERGSGFSRVTASLDFLLGESRGISARGRFLLGLTALRLFGPIRHWKHMFINDNFRTAQSEGIERWPIATAEDDDDDGGRRGSGKKHPNKKNDVCASPVDIVACETIEVIFLNFVFVRRMTVKVFQGMEKSI